MAAVAARVGGCRPWREGEKGICFTDGWARGRTRRTSACVHFVSARTQTCPNLAEYGSQADKKRTPVRLGHRVLDRYFCPFRPKRMCADQMGSCVGVWPYRTCSMGSLSETSSRENAHLNFHLAEHPQINRGTGFLPTQRSRDHSHRRHARARQRSIKLFRGFCMIIGSFLYIFC